MKGGFQSVHPIPCFLYYSFIMILSMLLFHPFFLATSLLSMIALNILHDSGRQLKRWAGYFLFTGLVIVVLNPLFSHRGAHILFYFWDNPITLESVIYGIVMMLSILTVLVAFVSYNQMVSSAKFVYLFSRVSPKLTLVLVIAIRFVPLLRRRLLQIALVQQTRGITIQQGSIRKRAKDGMKQLQMLLTWSLEEALQTADSMSARGYGLGSRSSYKAYKMEGRDWGILLLLVVTMFGLIYGWFLGSGILTIYPKLESLPFQMKDWLYYACFCLLLWIPIGIEWRERLRWFSWK